MLRPIMKRSDDSLEALRRVRAREVERAVLDVAKAERVASEAALRFEEATVALTVLEKERDVAKTDAVGSGGVLRAQDLALRAAWVSALDARVATATELQRTKDEAAKAAATAVASARRSLADAHAAERAIETHLEAAARQEARVHERNEEEDALEAHVARRP